MGWRHTLVPAAWLALAALTCGCSREADAGAQPTAKPTATAVATASSAPNEPDPSTVCREVKGASVWTFPRAPQPGEPMRVVGIATDATEATLEVGHDGQTLAEVDERRGGPPYWWRARIEAPAAGAHAIRLRTPDGAVCEQVEVGAEPAPRTAGERTAVWPVSRRWNRDTENLYSVWIEALFDAPLDEQPVWSALGELLRDPKRNLLHDHLGLGIDDPETAPKIEPDCADLPYTLRAYFAFKLGLPFGYSRCTRGSSRNPPSCQQWDSQASSNDGSSSPLRRLGNFLRVRLANSVHSGTVRVRGDDDEGDYYPVRIDERTLAPGTVFADPYGHILIIVKRIPQTDDEGGVLLAVDGQPDDTVSRRRFWRGNFLFSSDPVFGGPGFKRFRPVVVEDGTPRALDNAEIAAHPAYGDYDLMQYDLDAEGFYDAVEDVLSPEPRDPKQAFLATLQAFEEQVRRRVVSVDNAIAYKKDNPGRIDMPEGAEIFETTGPWEDYSTPARDMRLLIALDVARSMPERVAAHPERWAMPKGKGPEELEAELEALLEREAEKRTFSYTRSDGSKWELSLADVIDRVEAFEMSYNPNDCPEIRWAAPKGSEERSTCRWHAPAAQTRRMASYRDWFHDRTRPPRPGP